MYTEIIYVEHTINTKTQGANLLLLQEPHIAQTARTLAFAKDGQSVEVKGCLIPNRMYRLISASVLRSFASTAISCGVLDSWLDAVVSGLYLVIRKRFSRGITRVPQTQFSQFGRRTMDFGYFIRISRFSKASRTINILQMVSCWFMNGITSCTDLIWESDLLGIFSQKARSVSNVNENVFLP